MSEPRWRRHGARLCVALLGAALAVSLAPASSLAEDHPVDLAIHLGYGGAVKAGQWMPIEVDLTNHGPDMQATLEITVAGQDYYGKGPVGPGPGGGTPGAAYSVAVSLPAGSTRHIRTYLVSDLPTAPVRVSLVRNGTRILTRSATAATSPSLLLGVLSDSSAAFDEFGAIHFPNQVTATVVHLSREDMPDSAVFLQGFDLLAIDDYASDQLTGAQRAALIDYVAMGGHLLLGSGPAWRKTLTALPGPLRPIEPGGTRILPRSGALPGIANLEIAVGTLTSGAAQVGRPEIAGRAWLRDPATGVPLLVERGFGAGSVTLAAFDWTQDPIASWSGTRGLLRQVGLRSFFGGQASGIMPQGIGGGGVGFFGGSPTGSLTQRSSFLQGALSNLPALDLPSLPLTGLLVLLYILLVGPVNYLALRAARRPELAWVTVPVIAIAVAAAAYGIGVGTRGLSVLTNQVSIVTGASGWTRASRESYIGVFAPTRGNYTVIIDGPRPAIAPIIAGYQGGPVQGVTRVRPEDGAVDLQGVTAFSLRGFATQATVAAPALTAGVHLAQGQLIGSVHNGSSLRFDDVVVIAGDAYQRLGGLAPGADAAIGLAPKPVNTFSGPPAIFRVYSNNMFGGPPPGTPSATQRLGDERTQILQLLVGFKGPQTQSVQPILVAWTSQPLESLAINGTRPRTQAESAVVLPLSISRLEAGPLPAALIPAQLVDVSGEVQPNPGGVYVQDGSVTYEFSLPTAPGVRLAGATISTANPYGGKFGPAGPPPNGPGTAGIQQGIYASQVWDWTHGSWATIDLKDNGTAAIPDAAVDPLTGTVRLRVASINGDVFQLGSLSLGGTLQ